MVFHSVSLRAMSSPAKGGAASSSSAKKEDSKEAPKTSLELLEEDDEFEEFQGSWDDGKANDAEDDALWRDNWDDDDGQDDFMEQLRQHVNAGK